MTKFIFDLFRMTRKSMILETIMTETIDSSERVIEEMSKNLQGKNIFSAQAQPGSAKDLVNRNVLMQQDKHYQKMLQ